MITHAFDNQSPAIIQPAVSESAPRADACILTFFLADRTVRAEKLSL
jgi:hypothetical protein